ncbi:MAG: hypothetical protein K8T91_17045 [Planctomycetes bacterium]|nr:hypothetical protein [Planctomycetota bacterium]
MAIDVPTGEVHAFYAYLGQRLQQGDQPLSPEESLRDFREYQRQLEDLRSKLAEAERSSQRGQSQPLDMDALKARVRHRLSSEGIVD